MSNSPVSVLVLAPPKYVGALGVMRSLGRMGVTVYGLRHRGLSVSNSSRYCAGTFDVGEGGRPSSSEDQVLDELVRAGRSLGDVNLLIPASDEWAVFVARHRRELAQVFRFPFVRPELIDKISSKDGLHDLAIEHGVPTPSIAFPANADHAREISRTIRYPVMLKPVISRPGITAKAVVNDAESLLASYQALEESPEAPNVMFQEYIPGGDEDVWIFNGYFDQYSRCLAAFTGVKLRQHPAKMGIASLGACRQNSEVIRTTTRFLAEVGYSGMVDIGYRYDRRDGQYKILDVNPRVGGAFRLFVDANGLDVVRAQYLDLTGHRVPIVVPRDGRRWLKEDADLIAFKQYRRLHGLTAGAWLKSFRGVEEGATFSPSDPMPFVVAMLVLFGQTFVRRWRKRLARWSGAGSQKPVVASPALPAAR